MKRPLIFIISIAIIITSCMFHGIFGEDMTIRTIDKMIATGNITGKFWRIIDVQHDRVTVTKYKKTIKLVCHQQGSVEKGDRVSFVATSDNLTSSKSDLLWNPTKINIHGKSSFKFELSILSLIIVLFMCLRSIQFDRKTLSLIFRKEQWLCRMD